MERRSFLALMAGVLAVRPEQLTAPPAVPKFGKDSFGYWPYLVTDSFDIEPGKETKVSLFFPPMPSNFVVSSIGVHFPPEMLAKDLERVLNGLSMCVKSDNLSLLAGAIRVGLQGDARKSPMPVIPAIAPCGQFSVDMVGDGLQLEGPAWVQVALSGFVRVRLG